MTTLVIPDLHHKVKHINKFIAWLKTKITIDLIVFLGDYFDHWKDSSLDATATAKWLKESLSFPDRVHLIGNHDMPYLLPRMVEGQWCPGYTPEKDAAANNILTRDDWNKLKPAYYTQGWLLSHAGFSADVFASAIGLQDPQELVTRAENALDLLKGGMRRKEFEAGERMATGLAGGITWSDWNDEFKPLSGIQQIVGHSIGTYIRSKKWDGKKNYCIDCEGKLVVLITDGEVGVVKVQ